MAANELPAATKREEKLHGFTLVAGLLVISALSWTILPMLILGAFAATGALLGGSEMVFGVGALIKSNVRVVVCTIGLLSFASTVASYFVVAGTR